MPPEKLPGALGGYKAASKIRTVAGDATHRAGDRVGPVALQEVGFL